MTIPKRYYIIVNGSCAWRFSHKFIKNQLVSENKSPMAESTAFYRNYTYVDGSPNIVINTCSSFVANLLAFDNPLSGQTPKATKGPSKLVAGGLVDLCVDIARQL